MSAVIVTIVGTITYLPRLCPEVEGRLDSCTTMIAIGGMRDESISVEMHTSFFALDILTNLVVLNRLSIMQLLVVTDAFIGRKTWYRFLPPNSDMWKFKSDMWKFKSDMWQIKLGHVEFQSRTMGHSKYDIN
ncbi:hypothetical protein RF11_09240 [Thelohanellus kitauei]|uniref:Uncharacterized protein n=1 Tax=Thelohanellus kitauei TaxID=669202 RepID=A0A0C2MV55_THEKT|nr:hypothetical protein RF11_09240 [Thelohanellus kitauei]